MHVHKRITKRRYTEEKSGLKGRFVCLWNSLIFFVGEYSSVWPEIFRVLSRIKWRFLRIISGNTHPFSSFVHSRSETYYALLLVCLGLKLLPDIRHCVYWVLAEIWAPDMSHKISNKFVIDHCLGWKVIRLTWSLSRSLPNSVEIVTWNFSKKLFLENFSEILVQTMAILYQNLWNLALLSAIFILRPYCAEKIHASTFICCLHLGNEARP